MATKHTPGPWIGIDPKTKKFRSSPWRADNEQASSTMAAPIKAGRDTVALVVTDDWDRKDELHANARLIAAAPELLEALKSAEVLFACHCNDATAANWLDNARAAIAKATGE